MQPHLPTYSGKSSAAAEPAGSLRTQQKTLPYKSQHLKYPLKDRLAALYLHQLCDLLEEEAPRVWMVHTNVQAELAIAV